MDLKVVVASVLLMLFCSEVSSFHLQKREVQEQEPLAQFQEVAKGYWDQVSGTATGWIEQFKALPWNERLMDLYQKGVSAMNIYSGILVDQVYHWGQ